MNSAIALSRKITASDILVSSSSAFTTGATAAMALPPQIAVPELIRYESFGSKPIRRPTRQPTSITPVTETRVKSMPSLPASSDSYIFMPNPRPTTANCSRYFELFLENAGKGLPRISASAMPAKRARAGDTKTEAARRMRYSAVEIFAFILLCVL